MSVVRYNDFVNEVHLNLFKFGKKKWNMPGGLSLYTDNKQKLSIDDFKKFMKTPETLKKYFPKHYDKMEVLDGNIFDLDIDLDSRLFVWVKITDNSELGKIANPHPINQFFSHIDTTNYLLINCDLWKKNLELNVRLIQVYVNNELHKMPYNRIFKSYEKDNIKYNVHVNKSYDISVGDDIFNKSDLNWSEIKDSIIKHSSDKESKKKSEEESFARRKKLREPFFEELQETLFDLTLSISDILSGDVETSKDNILNKDNVFSLNANKSAFKGGDVDFLFEISKELKQLDVNIKNMDFHDGKLSDYVKFTFSLETGKYGHSGDLDIYFYWLNKWM